MFSEWMSWYGGRDKGKEGMNMRGVIKEEVVGFDVIDLDRGKEEGKSDNV